MTTKQKLESARMEVKALEAQHARESRLDSIELPGGQVLHLNEAGRAQQAEAVKVQTEADVRVFESLGMSKDAATAAAKGRPASRW